MKTFAQLLANPTSRPPEIVQAQAKDDFTALLAHGNLCPRQPGAAIPSGPYVVLGVATYSLPELQLLDEIALRHADWSRRGIHLAVFNVLECGSQQDIAKFIPGLAVDVRQTPIVAIWNDKSLDAVETGEQAARSLLKNAGIL